jgi:hypothetical protein
MFGTYYYYIIIQVYLSEMDENIVGIVTGYGLDDQLKSPGRANNFLFSTSSRPTLGPTQPPN